MARFPELRCSPGLGSQNCQSKLPSKTAATLSSLCASRGALATMQTPKHEAVKKTAAGNRECRGSRRLRLLKRQDRRAKPR